VNDPHSPQETYTPAMFQLRGRIGRVRYLAYSFVLNMLLVVCAVVLVTLAGDSADGLLVVKWVAAAAAAGLAVIVGGRRLHDMGYTCWAALVLLIPVVNLVFSLWLIGAPGNPGVNRFGLPPGSNSRAVIVLAWAVPVLFMAGVLAAIALAPHKSNAQRARDDMEQAI
jgi:uncharacterized membrane protein YhaH (DUF805 family)